MTTVRATVTEGAGEKFAGADAVEKEAREHSVSRQIAGKWQEKRSAGSDSGRWTEDLRAETCVWLKSMR